MKAISLWQPWATAIALDLKRNETRGWATRYRGTLAIHAAQRWQADQMAFTVLVREQIPSFPKAFPFGAIVAVARLVDCRPTLEVGPTVGFVERMFGNYGPERFAWLLEDVKPLAAPLAWKGKQGFFDVPAALLANA